MCTEHKGSPNCAFCEVSFDTIKPPSDSTLLSRAVDKMLDLTSRDEGEQRLVVDVEQEDSILLYNFTGKGLCEERERVLQVEERIKREAEERRKVVLYDGNIMVPSRK